MNYKLCSKVLSNKHCNDDVRELVSDHVQLQANYRNQELLLEAYAQEIKVLTAENRFLKEINDSI
jgi:hypothetical protein